MSAVVTQLGPLGVFILMVPESACIPVPSEVTLLAAGFAVHQGWMPFLVAVAAATAGNLVGSLIAYGFGRLASNRGVAGWARAGLSRCNALFSRHGSRTVFLARLMPLARTFVSLPAGHARVGVGRFVAMTALGCAIWATAFVLIGDILGTGWRAGGGVVGWPLLALGAVVVLAALAKARVHER
jgi:membrane protein DedA with SNARE-associated domain